MVSKLTTVKDEIAKSGNAVHGEKLSKIHDNQTMGNDGDSVWRRLNRSMGGKMDDKTKLQKRSIFSSFLFGIVLDRQELISRTIRNC